MSSTERWLPVVGWEGSYEVSDHGRVRSVDRIVMRSNGSPHTVRERIMCLHRNGRTGHLNVDFWVDGKLGRRKYVHRLVLEAFVGPCPPGLQACHWDDNPANNHLENLRWDTPSANSHDQVRNGRHPMARKTHCKNGHAFDAANTGIRADGGRDCRQCGRERSHRRYRDLRRVAAQRAAAEQLANALANSRIEGELPGQLELFEVAS